MRIVFFGTPQFAVPSLDRLLHHPEFEVVAVVTQPDKRRGRGKQLMPSPVKALAVEHQLPVWQPRRVKQDPETLTSLQAAQADAFIVVAYGQILSPDILAMPRLGCINAHGSLLPHYRGAAPIQWCLVQGEAETGIMTMLMDAGMDTGPMLLTAKTPIALLDNALDLAKILSETAADLLVETLQGLDRQEIQPIPQDDSQATYAPLIQKPDYELDWSKPAIALHNQVRGFFPNCVTQFRDQPLKVIATVPLDLADGPTLPPDLADLAQQGLVLAEDLASHPPAAPGTVVGLLKPHGAVVQTGAGLLLLLQVQQAGKRAQSGWDFVNGNRLEVGEMLQSAPKD